MTKNLNTTNEKKVSNVDKKELDLTNQKNKYKTEKKIMLQQSKKMSKEAKKFAKQQRNAESKFKFTQMQGLTFKLAEIAKEQTYLDFAWHKLDNSALIYPAISYENNALFRLSVTLNIEVDPETLQRALNDVVPRFPTMTSTLRAGLFWYYLDSPSYPVMVKEETELPCRPFKMDRRHALVRVLYRKYEIIAEFFHATTDGTGGLSFLNTLVATYLRHCGYVIADRTNAPHSKDLPRHEELIDSTQGASNDGEKAVEHIKALHLIGERLPKDYVIHRKAICDASKLKEASKEYNCTISQFLSACAVASIKKHCDLTLNKDKKPIRICVPCNLRQIFGGTTYRNFTSYIYATYADGTFEELIEHIKGDFDKQLNKEYFQRMINYNVSAQKHLLMRLAPLPFKNIALKMAYRMFGSNLNTYTLSNLGLIKAPKEFEEFVVRYEFCLGEIFGIGVSTYNNLTAITFSTMLKDTLFEREFVKILDENNIPLCIETVYGGEIK
ncbi:MAG: hypothetical protein RR207_01595 [Clostridia bacterium]